MVLGCAINFQSHHTVVSHFTVTGVPLIVSLLSTSFDLVYHTFLIIAVDCQIEYGLLPRNWFVGKSIPLVFVLIILQHVTETKHEDTKGGYINKQIV